MAAALAATTLLLAAAAAGAAGGRSEAELKVLRAQIERITQQVSRDALERDRLSRNLRDAEVSLGAARSELGRLRGELADRGERRRALAQQRTQQENALVAERAALSGQLRAAYLLGSQEPLKLLLNQRDPLRSGRVFVYYQYFGRARAGQIAGIEEHMRRIDALDTDLGSEQRRLADLQDAQQQQLARLERARGERAQVLASLEAQSSSRMQRLARLQAQQADLEKLLRELSRSLKGVAPPDNATVFGRLRGLLPWPVSGKLVAEFGDRRATGVRWEGLVVATERGAPVKAVAGGRVLYADWLPGLGLLVILDHGEGYLSLYGHNDRLYKAAGEQVDSGEVIAASGDTGGRDQPELYFEIRHSGHPVDPRPWFRQRGP
ncbi:MAG: murein hydrolase activator EnvC family protein [Steroidobacterales bacterium]